MPSAAEFWVARFNKQMVGCAALERTGNCGVLHSVAVEKAWRRHGIGHTLVRRCVKEAKVHRLRAIALTTMFWNIAFFKRLGFEPASRKRLPVLLQKHPDFSSQKFPYVIPMLLLLTPERKFSRRARTATPR